MITAINCQVFVSPSLDIYVSTMEDAQLVELLFDKYFTDIVHEFFKSD
jgi:hypothetical protein